MPRVYYGAYRTDLVDIDPGDGGIIRTNSHAILEAEPLDDTSISINTPGHAMVGQNHLYSTDDSYFMLINGFVYSTLLSFDRHNELGPDLAADHEMRDGFTEYEFILHDDAEFHDGEPVTADDVVFSYELFQEENTRIPAVSGWSYESIEAVGDETVLFTFSEPVPSWEPTTVPYVSILPEHIWGDADDPVEFQPDEIIGSGPTEVVTFRDEKLVQMDPIDDHWKVPDGPVEFRAYSDAQGEATALQNGDISILSDIPMDIAYDVLEDEDDIKVVPFESPTHQWIHLEHHFGLMMFRELRHAISRVLDREEIAYAAYRGDAEMDHYSADESDP